MKSIGRSRRFILFLLWCSLGAGLLAARGDAARSELLRERATLAESQEPQPPPSIVLSGPPPPPVWPDERVLAADEVLSVDTDLTNIYFTATDRRGIFLTTLSQSDIRVREDGIEQQIFAFERQTNRPLSLVILIDTSGSQERTLPQEKAAARAFINSVLRPSHDEAAIVSFSGDATLEQGLTGELEPLRRALERVEIVHAPPGAVMPPRGQPPPPGSTAIWEAVAVTCDQILERTTRQTRRAIILISDGVDSSSRIDRDAAVERALKTDAVIYSIGIGDSEEYEGVEKRALRRLSERTGGRAYFPENETELRAAFAQIEAELRAQYLVAYTPSNRRQGGSFRRVEIEIVNRELRRQNLRLAYRPGYYARPSAQAASQSQ